MRTRIDGIFFPLIAVLAFATPALSQTFGQITGIVTDPSGGVVVSATVTVTNPETNFTRSETTNTAGVYNFPNLQPGVYNIKVEMQGFRSEIRNTVELQVQQVARFERVGLAECVEPDSSLYALHDDFAFRLVGRDFLAGWHH